MIMLTAELSSDAAIRDLLPLWQPWKHKWQFLFRNRKRVEMGEKN